MKSVLTIAGSDCSGGAGIQADIKTITAHRMYGMSVITALTAQNTTGVYGIEESSPDFVALQMKCVFEDIFPDAVKIGMVSNAEIIRVIAAKLKEYGAKNIVADPAMVSTSGGRLLEGSAEQTLKDVLLPAADIITPNIREAEALSGMSIRNAEDMLEAAEHIAETVKCAVLIKGGHLEQSADDLLLADGKALWFRSERVDNPNTHGTGCTLSSAIACNLAAGRGLDESVRNAKEYITGALKANLDLGKGSGPLDHCFCI